MALQFIPILKALGPLVAEAGGLVASITGLRASSTASKADDRIRVLEEEMLRAGGVLTGVTQQLEALAQQFRAEAEKSELRERRLRQCLSLSIAALVVSVGSLVVAIAR